MAGISAEAAIDFAIAWEKMLSRDGAQRPFR
jgi:hypothetical protein